MRISDSSTISHAAHVRARRVLITGGSGFIARALIALAHELDWPMEFIIASRDDGKLRAAQERYPNIVGCARMDVADAFEVEQVVSYTRPHLLIHAAASKHVDLSELNAWDTYRTNVIGTANVAAAVAGDDLLERAVLISTDKAVMPVNTYGTTKLLGERLWQEAARWGNGPDFAVARYGNVIGSTGSALPRFKQWAAEGKRIQLTNPDHTRFWLPVSEALHTLCTALFVAPNGTVTVPLYIRANTLLEAVRGAVGSAEAIDIAGERPGEKKDEMMITARERGLSRAAGEDREYAFIPAPWVASAKLYGFDSADYLSSDAPWAGKISPAEIHEALLEAEGI